MSTCVRSVTLKYGAGTDGEAEQRVRHGSAAPGSATVTVWLSACVPMQAHLPPSSR